MRSSRALIVAVCACVVGVPPAVALDHTWSWARGHTDVSAENRTFEHRTPSAATGQQPAHELSARRDRADQTRGRASAAVKSRLETVVEAGRVRVTYFGRTAEADLDEPARLRVFVHCERDGEDLWALLGGKDVDPSTSTQTLSRAVTAEDCEQPAVDGVMLQVLAGGRDDRKRRTVFLQRAELGPQGAPVWAEDFTVP